MKKIAWVEATIEVGIMLLAIGIARWTPSPAQVEQLYSQGIYPIWAYTIISLTNALPFAFGDMLLIATVIGLPLAWFLALRRAGRQRWKRAALQMVLRTVAFGAFAYMLFVVTWGLNYDRPPLSGQLHYDPTRVTTQAKTQLLIRTIDELNALVENAHAEPYDETKMISTLGGNSSRVLATLGVPGIVVTARPKYSILDRYLGAVSTSGFTYPYSHETIIESSQFGYERPFTIAHEWGHVAGYADESEANFISFITTESSSDPLIRYSGWLALYSYLPHSEGEQLPGLDSRVEKDLQAVRTRVEQRKIEPLHRAENSAYDQYLKSSGVEAGLASYGLFVDLLLSADLKAFGFDPRANQGVGGAP